MADKISIIERFKLQKRSVELQALTQRCHRQIVDLEKKQKLTFVSEEYRQMFSHLKGPVKQQCGSVQKKFFEIKTILKDSITHEQQEQVINLLNEIETILNDVDTSFSQLLLDIQPISEFSIENVRDLLKNMPRIKLTSDQIDQLSKRIHYLDYGL